MCQCRCHSWRSLLKGRMKTSVTSGESENLKSVKILICEPSFCANEKVPALNQ